MILTIIKICKDIFQKLNFVLRRILSWEVLEFLTCFENFVNMLIVDGNTYSSIFRNSLETEFRIEYVNRFFIPKNQTNFSRISEAKK